MTLIVMLIWAGNLNGGPTTIQGFASLEACQTAEITVQERLGRLRLGSLPWSSSGIFTDCVELE